MGLNFGPLRSYKLWGYMPLLSFAIIWAYINLSKLIFSISVLFELNILFLNPQNKSYILLPLVSQDLNKSFTMIFLISKLLVAKFGYIILVLSRVRVDTKSVNIFFCLIYVITYFFQPICYQSIYK